MKRYSRALVNLLLAVLLVTVAGCATLGAARHQYVMRGQILDVTDGEAYLCIGSAEGAKAGQEYTVYRFIKEQPVNPKLPQVTFKRDLVGAVKITEVVAEHYAKARVVRGEIKVNDVAELTP